jgi:hypothetical protein
MGPTYPARAPQREKGPHPGVQASEDYPGGVLLSQGVAPQVPSALVGLTSVFGMGTGVAPPLWPPGTLLDCKRAPLCRRSSSFP